MVTPFQFAGKGEGRELGRIGSRARLYKGQTSGGEDDNEQNVEKKKLIKRYNGENHNPKFYYTHDKLAEVGIKMIMNKI